MRTAARTFFAFVLSILGASVVVQVLAVWLRGQEGYIALFVLPVFVAVVTTVLFLLARLARDPKLVVGIMAKTLIALFLMGFVGLMLAMLINGGPETLRSELGIVVGIFLPAAVVVLIQWQMFTSLKSGALPRFGRGTA